MDVLRENLMAQARAKGICADGFRTLSECEDRAALLAYYVANPDWCMEHGFPDMATLRESFGDCEAEGVFVDREFHGEVLDRRLVYVFHNCRGTIRVGFNADWGVIPMLYACNGSRLVLRASSEPRKGLSPSRVPVYIFGKNDVSCHGGGAVKFVKYRHEVI